MKEPKSIVITGVDFYEVPHGEKVYYHHAEQIASYMEDPEATVDRCAAIEREEVKPFYVKRFPAVNVSKPPPTMIPDPPEEYYIYAYPDVQDKLGLVYDAWNDMSVRINQDYATIARQRQELLASSAMIAKLTEWKKFYETGNIFTRILKVLMQ